MAKRSCWIMLSRCAKLLPFTTIHPWCESLWRHHPTQYVDSVYKWFGKYLTRANPIKHLPSRSEQCIRWSLPDGRGHPMVIQPGLWLAWNFADGSWTQPYIGPKNLQLIVDRVSLEKRRITCVLVHVVLMFDVWTLLVQSSQHLQHSIAGVEETTYSAHSFGRCQQSVPCHAMAQVFHALAHWLYAEIGRNYLFSFNASLCFCTFIGSFYAFNSCC
jgi:hypothetical protein